MPGHAPTTSEGSKILLHTRCDLYFILGVTYIRGFAVSNESIFFKILPHKGLRRTHPCPQSPISFCFQALGVQVCRLQKIYQWLSSVSNWLEFCEVTEMIMYVYHYLKLLIWNNRSEDHNKIVVILQRHFQKHFPWNRWMKIHVTNENNFEKVKVGLRNAKLAITMVAPQKRQIIGCALYSWKSVNAGWYWYSSFNAQDRSCQMQYLMRFY